MFSINDTGIIITIGIKSFYGGLSPVIVLHIPLDSRQSIRLVVTIPVAQDPNYIWTNPILLLAVFFPHVLLGTKELHLFHPISP